MTFHCKCPSSLSGILSVIVQNLMREDMMASVCPMRWVFTPGPGQGVGLLRTDMLLFNTYDLILFFMITVR